ncbi:MAG: hypothetical protein II989_02210 [Bacteroidales bacterium]|nr:hypothetical protein [Bacteroidales bacterium]
MKKILLFFASFILLTGCAEDDDKYYPPCGITMCTAEKLSEELFLYFETYGNSAFVPNKENFVLGVLTKSDPYAYCTSYMSGSEEEYARTKWLYGFLNNGLREYGYNNSFNTYRDFTVAGIAEGSRIYADRVLWGREAGEDLGDMFSIPRYLNDVIVSYPDFHILYGCDDRYPSTFREFTSERIALNGIQSPVVFLAFKEIPSEDFDTLTLTVEIPVDIDYYEDYSPEMYELHPNLKPEGRRLLKGAGTFQFVPVD